MNNKVSVFRWFSQMFKEFATESISRPQCEIVDIFECSKTGFIRAVIKLSASHSITKNISDVVIDNTLIEALDKKTIRTLTYMATVEKMKPDYSVVVQQLSDEVDGFILEIKSRSNGKTFKKSPSEISKDKELLVKFNQIEAHRIGYLAGVRETVKEFESNSNKS